MSGITPQVGPDPRDLTVKGRATRAALLEAARAVFGRLGRRGLTHANVAARAGVARGLVYRYFPRVEDLLAELEAEAAAFVAQAFINPTARFPYGNERLRASFDRILCPPLGEIEQSRLTLQAIRHVPGVRAVVIGEIRRDLKAEGCGHVETRAAALLEALMGILDATLSGRMCASDARMAASLLMRMLQ